ncbi:MAG: NAD(P)/FAD-dependent oxidoreductase, partial [Hydrogenophaga sp.]|nr:NAD(P)/FAD-dependent oxidoreductase [Hydrogenophaga sp.]
MSESPSTLAHADQPHVAPEQLPAIETDALIIGAGPVGLFQVFQLGLLEVGCHVVDALPYVGGQPAELYPDKPIYDLPGVPVATGRELTSALLRQIEPFKPQVHMGQTVQSLERQPDGRFLVRTSRKVRFLVRAVLIAAGVGAFEPRTLTVPGLSDWESRQVFYRVADMPETSGREILVVGGGEEAIDAIGDLLQDPTRAPAGITLMHRRDHFQAPSDALEQLTQWRE